MNRFSPHCSEYCFPLWTSLGFKINFLGAGYFNDFYCTHIFHYTDIHCYLKILSPLFPYTKKTTSFFISNVFFSSQGKCCLIHTGKALLMHFIYLVYLCLCLVSVYLCLIISPIFHYYFHFRSIIHFRSYQ